MRYQERRVVGNLSSEVQIVATLLRKWQTDQTASMAGHEVDNRGRNLFGRTNEVTFIFPVLVIDDYDHFAVANVADSVINRSKSHAIEPFGSDNRTSGMLTDGGCLEKWSLIARNPTRIEQVRKGGLPPLVPDFK